MNATVPLASVLIGAGLTYWLGIRTRKRTFVEDLFNEAITAVAVADASQHYIRDVTQPQALSVEEYVEVRKQVARVAIENHARAAGEARAALARVLQHEPRVRPYYVDPTAVTNRPDEIVSFLVTARNQAISRRFGVPRRRKNGDRFSGLQSSDGQASHGPATVGHHPFGTGMAVPSPPRPTGGLGTTYGEDADHFYD